MLLQQKTPLSRNNFTFENLHKMLMWLSSDLQFLKMSTSETKYLQKTTNKNISREEGYQKTIEQNEKIIQTLDIKKSEGFWVFGYGSLVWKVNFDYKEAMIGTIDGYKRRFWQGSTDHRGTFERPGRVVTLIKGTETDKLWGKAYFVPPKHVNKTLDTLNFREKGGYSLTKVAFTPRLDENSSTDNFIQVLLYIAIEGNVNYIGEEPLEAIALRISTSVGPSGPNIDYLYNLAKFLEENDLVNEDDRKHTIELRDRVFQLLRNNLL